MNLKKILEAVLNLLLPKSPALRMIEAMSPEEFRKAARSRAAFPRNSLPDTIILFDYENPLVREAVWSLKYRGNEKAARLLAECLYEELASELSERKSFESFESPMLIPIPLSKKRQGERGFNQCELLADILFTLRGGNFFEVRKDALVRTRDTESQTKKNRAARLENLKNCFAVRRPEDVAGRNIILLDDVTTTGATFEEARKTLLSAGARKILSVAVAH